MNCGHEQISCDTACTRLGVSVVTAWAYIDPSGLAGLQFLAAVLSRQTMAVDPSVYPVAQLHAPPRYAVVLNAAEGDTRAETLRVLLDCAGTVKSASYSSTLVQQGLQLIVASLISSASTYSTIEALVTKLAPTGEESPQEVALQACMDSAPLSRAYRAHEDRVLSTVYSSLNVGQNALLLNGRWAAMPSESKPLLPEDLVILESEETVAHVSHALSLLEGVDNWSTWSAASGAAAADRIAIVASLLEEPLSAAGNLELPCELSIATLLSHCLTEIIY